MDFDFTLKTVFSFSKPTKKSGNTVSWCSNRRTKYNMIELSQIDAKKLNAELFAAVEAANMNEINRIVAEQEKIVQFLKQAEDEGADPAADFDEEKLDIVNKTRDDGKTPLLLAVDKGTHKHIPKRDR